MPDDAGREFLRVAREALANVRRHAAVRRVKVTLSSGPDEVGIEASDDGKGFVPDGASRSLGTVSMRGRAAALGGKMTVESAPGEGSRGVFIGPRPV